MIDKNGDADFTTVIGGDAVFKGELSFEKGVRVDGRIEGKITTPGQIAVSQAGKLQADVQAGNIIVEGQVNGNLAASSRIELRKTARLKGDIKAKTLLVAEGAAFTGHCQVGADAGIAAGTPGTPGAPGASGAPTNRIAQKEPLPRK